MTAQEAAERAVRFWVRDWDQRDTPLGMREIGPDTVIITPTAGMRVWVYCAELPWDPEDGPQGSMSPVGWCASSIYVEGELGVIHTDDGTFTEISREEFLLAAGLGWPDWEPKPMWGGEVL